MANLKPISFIPISINFSEMEKYVPEDCTVEDLFPGVEDDRSGDWVEQTIMVMLSCLQTDRQRVMLLLQIMRGDGYRFEHKNIAKLYGIKMRWYWRMTRAMRQKLAKLKLV